jgi:hypothetical protein
MDLSTTSAMLFAGVFALIFTLVTLYAVAIPQGNRQPGSIPFRHRLVQDKRPCGSRARRGHDSRTCRAKTLQIGRSEAEDPTPA